MFGDAIKRLEYAVKQRPEALVDQVISAAGVNEVHWGMIVSAGSHQLYRRMRDLHPQIHHRASGVIY